MAHDILVWLLDLMRNGAQPIRTAAGTSSEAIDITVWGRTFRIHVEEVG